MRFISFCSMTAIKCQDLCKLPLNQCFVKRYRNAEWGWTCSAPSLELCLFDLCPGSNLTQALGEPSSLAMHFSNNVKAEGKTFTVSTNHCRSSVLPCRMFPATEQRLYLVLLWPPQRETHKSLIWNYEVSKQGFSQTSQFFLIVRLECQCSPDVWTKFK